jgi:hypothetical protein
MEMRTRTRKPLLVLSTFVVLGLAACGGGDGGPPTAPGDGTLPPDETRPPPGDDAGGPFGNADVEITIEHPERDTVRYRVVCEGDLATVTGDVAQVDENEACATLADPDAVTRLVEGPPEDQMCTEIYGGPDVATIVGTVDGDQVDATVDRTNGCGIADWDDLLGGLLPPAVGVVG